jgi:hypothetical protein
MINKKIQNIIFSAIMGFILGLKEDFASIDFQ